MRQALSHETIQKLKEFFRHPMQEIQHLPSWPLGRVLLVQVICAAISGICAGLFPPSLWKFLNGLILFPILVTMMSLLLTCFFYYSFQIFEKQTVSFVKLSTLVFFATLPYFLFHIPSTIFPPSDLFGLGMEALLLAMGLTENFQLAKKRSLRLVGVVFGILFVLWLTERFSSTHRDRLPDSIEDARPR